LLGLEGLPLERKRQLVCFVPACVGGNRTALFDLVGNIVDKAAVNACSTFKSVPERFRPSRTVVVRVALNTRRIGGMGDYNGSEGGAGPYDKDADRVGGYAGDGSQGASDAPGSGGNYRRLSIEGKIWVPESELLVLQARVAQLEGRVGEKGAERFDGDPAV
jgi:hypothetical protein